MTKMNRLYINEDSMIKKHLQNESTKLSSMKNYMKMGQFQNIQSFETCIETGNLRSYDERSI